MADLVQTGLEQSKWPKRPEMAQVEVPIISSGIFKKTLFWGHPVHDYVKPKGWGVRTVFTKCCKRRPTIEGWARKVLMMPECQQETLPLLVLPMVTSHLLLDIRRDNVSLCNLYLHLPTNQDASISLIKVYLAKFKHCKAFFSLTKYFC